MIRIEIAITAPDEETVRRAMDEIIERAIDIERDANRIERDIGGTKGAKLAARARRVVPVLDAIADALDSAQPRKVI